MRAEDVILGLRALAKKCGPQVTKLDVDDVIRGSADARRWRRAVVLHTELDVGGRPVMGDCVWLQKMLLNLIMIGF